LALVAGLRIGYWLVNYRWPGEFARDDLVARTHGGIVAKGLGGIQASAWARCSTPTAPPEKDCTTHRFFRRDGSHLTAHANG